MEKVKFNKEEYENILNQKSDYKCLSFIKHLNIIYILIIIYSLLLLYLIFENDINKQEIKKLI